MDKKLRIMLLGSGGRECAIAWKLSRSKHLDRLYIAPGNAGTEQYGENVDVSINDFEQIAAVAVAKRIDMIIVGSEEPLVGGIVDYFAQKSDLARIKIIGPSKAGARLEGSKEFAKEFMNRHNIPTARHLTVQEITFEEGVEFMQQLKPPYVLKADGLAAGKGVIIAPDLATAKQELAGMLNGKFGKASESVVIEEFLHGIECSVFVLTDGTAYRLLPVAKDYKRVGEGETGLNTGGMGSVSPVSFADKAFMNKVRHRIIEPTIKGLQEERLPYLGFIFFGLMNVDGEPYVIEYNVRMGDPETEVVMPRIKSDLVELLWNLANGRLCEQVIEVDPRYAVTVMMVSEGYPGAYRKGLPIEGLDDVSDSIVFHAGTKRASRFSIVTNGGRVLAVTSLAPNKKMALRLSYESIKKIRFDKAYYRTDIGFDLK